LTLQSIVVDIADDEELEDTENFFILLTDATAGAVIGPKNMAEVETRDNDGSLQGGSGGGLGCFIDTLSEHLKL
jgi:hypothetical protein